MTFKDLDRGDKVDVHLSLYADEIDIIDQLRAQYNCSRASVIGAMVKEHAAINLTDKVKEGRREGGGRKPTPK